MMGIISSRPPLLLWRRHLEGYSPLCPPFQTDCCGGIPLVQNAGGGRQRLPGRQGVGRVLTVQAPALLAVQVHRSGVFLRPSPAPLADPGTLG